MELEPAVRRHLLDQPPVRGYVQDRVHTFTLHDHVCPHGTRAIVVRRSSGWGRPEPRSGAEFPLLYIDCWADRSRDASGNATAADEITNAYAVYRVLDPLLQGKRGETWGTFGTQHGLPIISCERFSEPFHQTAGDSHAGASSPLPYGVPLQQAAVVTVAYAIHTHH